MVLGDALIDREGRSRRMSGLLPLVTSFAERRLHLGYRRAILRIGSPLGPAGAVFRGHEFHYATITRQGAATPLFSVFGSAGEHLGACGLRQASVFGSFIHLIDREFRDQTNSAPGSSRVAIVKTSLPALPDHLRGCFSTRRRRARLVIHSGLGGIGTGRPKAVRGGKRLPTLA